MELEKIKKEIAKLEVMDFLNDVGKANINNLRLKLLSLTTSDDKVIVDTIHTNDTIVNLKKEKETKKEPTNFGGLFDKI